MPQKIATVSALIAFAICLAIGLHVSNPFTTTVLRALTAMLVTLPIGWVIGWMAQKMLDENLRAAEEKLKIPEPDSPAQTDK
jgi:NhaP-type Na+/H+ or K+/H+ antiporter